MNYINLTTFLNNKRFHLVFVSLSGIFLFLLFAQPVSAIVISPPRLELSGDPGTTIRSEFQVTNDSDSNVIYYTQTENFEAQDESGQPSFVPTKKGLATWVGVNDSVSVKAGELATIPFTISLPKNAEPGGYFASIFVRTTPPPRSGGEVSIGARIGTLLLVRVNGDIQEGIDILEFGTKDSQKLFTSLPINFYYRFQNTGADRVKPEGSIVIKNILGMTSQVLPANRSDGSVLPRSIRRFESTWSQRGQEDSNQASTPVDAPQLGFFDTAWYQTKNFAFGMYTANLDIRFGENNNTATGKYRFFVIPWQLLIIVVVSLLLILTILRFVLRSYNQYIIQQHQKK